MAISGSLPLVGAQAVILGMAVFNSNARTVTAHLRLIGQAASTLQNTSTRAFSGVGAGAGGMGVSIAAAAAVSIGALVALGAAAIRVGQTYDRTMAFIGAVSESTAAQIGALSDQQIELSRHSTQSASDLAKASSEMVKAGTAIEQVTAEGLQAVNNLIVASNGELQAAQAALIAQVAIATFGESVETAANVATAAVQTSTLTFTGFADALRQGGASADRVGLSLRQFGAIVATVGQEITSGTQIGTDLRSMFDRLQAPSQAARDIMIQYKIGLHDVNGAVRPVIDVLGDLERQFSDNAVAAGKLTAQERDYALATLFTSRSVRTVTVLLNQGTAKYLELLEATEKLTASRLAQQMLLPTAAILEILGNNAQAAGLKFNQGLDPFINKVAGSLLSMVQAIDIDFFKNLGDAIGGTLYNAFANLGNIIDTYIIPVWGPLMAAIGNVADSLHKLIAVTTGVGASMQTSMAQPAVDAFMFMWRVSLLAIEGMTDGLNFLADVIDRIVVWFGDLKREALSTANTFSTAVVEAIKIVISEFLHVEPVVTWVLERLRFLLIGVVAAFYIAVAVVRVWGEWTTAIFKYVAEATQTLRDINTQATQSMNQAWDTLRVNVSNAINGVLGFMGRMLDGFVPLGEAPVQMANTWASAWTGIADVVGRAVRWILGKVNDLLDGLASVPLIGEAISSARAAVDGAFGAVARFGVQVSNTVSGVVANARSLYNSVATAIGGIVETVNNVKIPFTGFTDFAQGVRDSFAAAAAARDALLQKLNRNPAVPDAGTEPGDPLGGGGDNAAEKAAEKLANLIDRARELVRDFNDDVLKETAKVAGDVEKLYREAADDIAVSMTEAARDIADVIEDSNNEIQKLHIERDIQENERERHEALENMLDEELRIRKEQQEEIEVLHDRELEADQRAFDELQEIARRENDERIDAAARARDIDRADEDRTFDKSLEAREKALDKILDAEEKAQEKQQDLREEGLRDRQDAEKVALEQAQDMREAALKKQFDTEARLREEAKDLAEITRKDTEGRVKAEAEYTKELSIGVKQSIAQARFNEKIAKIQEETAADKLEFDRRKTEASADLEFEAQQEAKLLELRVKSDAEKLALEVEHDKQQRLLRETFEIETTRLQEEHERRRIALRDTLEQEALDRSRARAEEDRIFANEQEREKRAFAEKQERDALAESRKVQDAERIRSRGLELLETDFKKGQDEKRNALSKQLEEEDFQRKLANIRLEHDKRITQIEATLAEEQQKTRDKLAQDITDLNQNLKERIETMRSQYVDRLEDIMREGGDAIRPIVDEITGNIAAGLDSITEAANGAVAALAAAFDASEKLASAQSKLQASRDVKGGGGAGGSLDAPVRPGGKPGESYDEAKNYLENTGASPKEIEALIGKPRQYGGTVEGPYGAPMWIKAHGGEHFEGVGQHATIMTAVRMAEAMYNRGTHGAMGVTNNYDYTVNANYGRVQEPGSVTRDMSALVAQTRR